MEIQVFINKKNQSNIDVLPTLTCITSVNIDNYEYIESLVLYYEPC